MNLFRRASIKNKQVMIIMVITTIALLLACAGLTAYEVVAFRATMVGNLTTLAEIVGNNAAGALDFNDPTVAEDTVAALSVESHIVGVAIYSAAGKPFAKYGSHFTPPPQPPVLGHAFRGGYLTLCRSIISKGEVIGTIYIVSDVRALYSRLSQYAAIIITVLILTLISALAMSNRMHKLISDPILQLARAARAVGKEKNYSVRIEKHYPDEIGVLIEGFNRMLEQIQVRELELQNAKDVLELRVKERTTELAEANTALQKENLERTQAEAAVRRTETLYRRAISGADAVPYGYDYQTRSYIFIGEGIEKLVGYTAQEITPALWVQITQESVMCGETAGLEKSEAGKRVIRGQIRNWRCDMRVRARDGTLKWITDASVQTYNDSGNFVGSIGVLQDITERKASEEALRSQEERTRLVIDQAFDAVITTDNDFKIIGWNLQAEKTLGWSLSDILGRSLLDTIVPAHRRETRRADLEHFKTTGTWPDQCRLVQTTAMHADGREVQVELTVTPIRTPVNCMFTIFLRDITERQLAEAKLEKMHKELVDASRKAGMAEVATSVLHNVGNVLNSVNVSTTLLLDSVAASKSKNVSRLAALIGEHKENLPEFFATNPKGKQVPAYLAVLASELEKEREKLTDEIELTRKNIEHIKNIVSMQQSYAKFSGVIEKVSPVELLDDALRMNEAALKRHEVQIVRDVPPQVAHIMADKNKILQILVNLIRNAKYACDESSQEDKLITLGLRDDGKRVRFDVLDNGVGIPEENILRIFNHGFTTRQNGHGFGLHASALAAHEMGGTLTAHSDGPGAGARFILELPLESLSKS